MFVIMDLEWVQRKATYPTQLAAIRVNSSWEAVDRFSMLIRPSFVKINWKHVAFSGYERDEFRNAYGASAVFTHFKLWMKDDDTLVWWAQKPAGTFLKMTQEYLQSKPVNQMKVIKWAVDDLIPGNGHTRSAYELAADLGIAVPEPEHSSSNDVETVMRVCRQLNLDQDRLPNMWSRKDGQDGQNRQNGQNERREEVNGTTQKKPGETVIQDLPYYYDHKGNLLHSKHCLLLSHKPDGTVITNAMLTGHGSLKNCIKERYIPCTCCKEEYKALDDQLRKHVIESTQFSYVYRAKSSVFHKPTCFQVTRIPFMDVRGATYYDSCLENGKRPCGWCKPKRSDEVEPLHIYPADMLMGEDFISKDEMKRIWIDRSHEEWGATRKLSENEKVALKRHRTAAKERMNKPENLSEQQQHDFMTLTQPGFAFWAQEGYSTFHLRSCRKIGGLSNLRGFARFSDATRSGYKPCRFCKPTYKNDILHSVPIIKRRRDTETVEDLDKLCEKMGWTHEIKGQEYLIETPTGKWKIISGTQPVDVYHINKVTQPGETAYHKQHRLFISMTDTVAYIKQHDMSLIKRGKGE